MAVVGSPRAGHEERVWSRETLSHPPAGLLTDISQGHGAAREGLCQAWRSAGGRQGGGPKAHFGKRGHVAAAGLHSLDERNSKLRAGCTSLLVVTPVRRPPPSLRTGLPGRLGEATVWHGQAETHIQPVCAAEPRALAPSPHLSVNISHCPLPLLPPASAATPWPPFCLPPS